MHLAAATRKCTLNLLLKLYGFKAFKMDLRFLYDPNGRERDVGTGEVAREVIDEDKILHDKSKLLREGKDVLDRLLNTVFPETDAQNSLGIALQIKGLAAHVISINLTSTGLYVAKPIFSINFPRSLLELADFSESFKNLFHFARLLEDNAKLYESALISRKRMISSLDNDFNIPASKQPPHSLFKAIKPTFYSPSSGKRTLCTFNYSNICHSSTTPSPSHIPEEKVYNTDENGWCLMENGIWFHPEAGIYLDSSP